MVLETHSLVSLIPYFKALVIRIVDKFYQNLRLMKKFGILILIILSTTIFASLYGAIHDQLSYTISPEYFTKFKYAQFGLEPVWFGGDRQTVAVIGILATWWTGTFIGLWHGVVGLIHKDNKIMLNVICNAILINLITAFSIGLIGFIYGKIYLSKTGVNWRLPANLIDIENYIAVGSMHNFSYLGGLIGLMIGIGYQLRKKHQATRDLLNGK